MREELNLSPKIKILIKWVAANRQKEDTMDKREFLNAIVEANVEDEIRDYAQAALEAMDAANAKNRAKAAEKRAEKNAEKAPIRDAIFAVITEEPKTATTLIAEAEVEIKPQAIPALLKGLVDEGVITKENIKVAGAKGTHVGYKRA